MPRETDIEGIKKIQEEFEHVVKERFFHRIDELLAYGDTCVLSYTIEKKRSETLEFRSRVKWEDTHHEQDMDWGFDDE